MSNKPIAKIVYKDKSGKNFEIGTIWPSTDRDGNLMEGLGQFRPVAASEEDLDAQYPKMAARRAIGLWEKKDGYLNVWMTQDKPDSSGRKMPQKGASKKAKQADLSELDDEFDGDGF